MEGPSDSSGLQGPLQALDTPQVMEAIMFRLPPQALANCALACGAWHRIVQVRLAFLQLQADAKPASALESATSLELQAGSFLGAQSAACRVLARLLPRLPRLQRLSLDLAGVPEPRVHSVLLACSPLQSLTHLSFERANLSTVSPQALTAWVPYVAPLRHLSLAGASLSSAGARAVLVAVQANLLLTTLDLSNHTLPDELLSCVLLACPPTLQHLYCSPAPHTHSRDRRWRGRPSPRFPRCRTLSHAVQTMADEDEAQEHMYHANFLLTELATPQALPRHIGLMLLRMTSLQALHFGGHVPAQHTERLLRGRDVLSAIAGLSRLTALTIAVRMFVSCTGHELACGIAPLKRLQQLRLQNHDCGDLAMEESRFQAMCACLVTLTGLTCLELSQDWYARDSIRVCFQIAAVVHFLSALRSLQIRAWPEHLPEVQLLVHLTRLRLWVCDYGNGSGRILEEALQPLTALADLELDHNLFGSDADVLPAVANAVVTRVVLRGFEAPRHASTDYPATLSCLTASVDWRYASHVLSLLRPLAALTSLTLGVHDLRIPPPPGLNGGPGYTGSDAAVAAIGEALAHLHRLRALALTLPTQFFVLPMARALATVTALTGLTLMVLNKVRWVHLDAAPLLAAAVRNMRMLKELKIDRVLLYADPLAAGLATSPCLTALSLMDLCLHETTLQQCFPPLSELLRLSLCCVKRRSGDDDDDEEEEEDLSKDINPNWQWLSPLTALTNLHILHDFTCNDVPALAAVLPGLEQLQWMALDPEHEWPAMNYGDLADALAGMTHLHLVDLRPSRNPRCVPPIPVHYMRGQLLACMPNWFAMHV